MSCFFFFFKQKTAYEMRISDWSSDVCSSDLALGRRFVIAQHPRLAAIMASREPTWFEPDSRLPDPYDGLLDNHVGEPLPVHDCMGGSLYVEGRLWGAITLDALHAGTFDRRAREEIGRGCSRGRGGPDGKIS